MLSNKWRDIKFILASLMSISICKASELDRFNPDFLRVSDGVNAKEIDLTYFEKNDGLPPGNYQVWIYINGEKVGNKSLNFRRNKDQKGIHACFDKGDLRSWGVINSISEETVCEIGLTSVIDNSYELFNEKKMELHLYFPNSMLERRKWRSLPVTWNQGIPAFLLNYNYTGISQRLNKKNEDNYFLRVDSSLNINRWRLRTETSMMKNNKNSGNENVYLERDYEQYQGGRIVIGNSYINSELFDNFPFKGVKFSSDDSMLDSSFSEFTPSIRGIAHSPSIVTVKQNGNIVLQKEVPAGVFEIDDIPYNFGGDYIIEVNGSDGVKNTFTQANASLPFLQKEGRTNHYLALGKLRHQYGTDTYEPNFILYHIAKGLRFGNTLHHGGIISNEYKSILFGGGTYHPYLGAFSVDYTFSEREDRKYEGRGRGDKFEFSYSRNIDLTSANLSMHMNIFDKDYLNFQEHAYSFNGNANTYEKTKRNFGVRLTQPIDYYANFSLQFDKYSYYKNRDDSYSFLTSISTNFKKISSSLSLGYNKFLGVKDADKTINFMISLPLWNGISSNNFISSSSEGARIQSGVSGFLEEQQLSWGVSHESNKSVATTNSSVNWKTSFSQINGAYSVNNDMNRLFMGIRGGVAIHDKGITFSQPLSFEGGNAVVDANGISDIVINNNRVHTDYFGNAIVTDLSPYQKNNISVNLSATSDAIDITNTDTYVVPSHGALTYVELNAVKGNRVLFKLNNKSQKIPLGAMATITGRGFKKTEFIGYDEKLYMNGVPEKGVVVVKWSVGGEDYACTSKYSIRNKKSLNILSLMCN